MTQMYKCQRCGRKWDRTQIEPFQDGFVIDENSVGYCPYQMCGEVCEGLCYLVEEENVVCSESH